MKHVCVSIGVLLALTGPAAAADLAQASFTSALRDEPFPDTCFDFPAAAPARQIQ